MSDNTRLIFDDGAETTRPVDQLHPLPVSFYTGGASISEANPLPVAAGTDYETVAANQTDQILGATGAVGDYLSGVLIVPATLSPGAVSIKDGNGSAITIFTGGAGSVSNLVPFFVPIGAKCTAATTPGWKVTTGSSVSAVGVGAFS